MTESTFYKIKDRLKEAFERLTFETEHASRFNAGVHIINSDLAYDKPFTWSYTGYEKYKNIVRSVSYRLDFKNDEYSIISSYKSDEHMRDFEKRETYDSFEELVECWRCETLNRMIKIPIEKG
jgi:hypothetical protein